MEAILRQQGFFLIVVIVAFVVFSFVLGRWAKGFFGKFVLGAVWSLAFALAGYLAFGYQKPVWFALGGFFLGIIFGKLTDR